MDHIQDLSAFQGVILSADNVYSFSKLKSKGGNEEKVKYVVEKVSNFLKEKNYITENGVTADRYDEFQKLALYLVLNADLPVLEEMTDMDGMEAVIWMLPTVPGHLLSELFWNLHMEPFLYQIVAFCEPRLALQVADAFIADMKYLDPARQSGRVTLVAGALYRLACRLALRRAAAPPAAALAAAARAGLRACLAQLAAPACAARVLALPRDDRYRHLGRSLSLMLRLIGDCLGHFASVQRFEAEGLADIYLATHPPGSVTTETLNFKICDGPDGAVLECLRECNALLLDECATRVMSVSVDVFCAWSEYEEDGRSMQRTIGELCHETGALLRGVPGVADHALAGMLEPLSREPVKVDDVIDETAPEAIAERLDARDADSAAWLAALLRRRDLCRSEALLRLVEARLPALGPPQAAALFAAVAGRARGQGPHEDRLRLLAVGAFRRCSVAVQDGIVDEQFADHLHDRMESVEFDDMLTDTFNRLTGAPDADPAVVLPVFVQNPKRTLVKIFRSAGDGARQADVMLRIMERLAGHHARRYRRDAEPAVVAAAAAALAEPGALAGDARRDGLVRFLGALRRRGVLGGGRLLAAVAMPRLHAALRARDARALGAAARLLRGALEPRELAAARAVLLAAAAQALDAARAPPAAFTPDAPDALDQFIRLKDRLFETYEGRIPDAELAWLRSRLARAAPLTRAHFPRLAPAAPALGALVRRNCMVVLTLSPREWDALLPRGADASAVRAACSALRRAARAERPRRTPASAACLAHAHAALAAAIEKNYFSQPPTDEQVLAVVDALETLAAGEPAAAGQAADEPDAARQAADEPDAAGQAADEPDAALLAAAWLPLLAHVAAARPELRARLAQRLAASPGLARPFARVPPH